MTFST